MGEKIRDLSSFTVGDTETKIELNDGYDKNYAKYDIHIQSKALQLCMSNVEFMKFASSVITAKRLLDDLKGR